VEGAAQEGKALGVVRHERDEQSQDSFQEKCSVCDEREANSDRTAQPVSRQYVLRLLGQRELVFGHGLAQRGRFAVPHLHPSQIQRGNN